VSRGHTSQGIDLECSFLAERMSIKGATRIGAATPPSVHIYVVHTSQPHLHIRRYCTFTSSSIVATYRSLTYRLVDPTADDMSGSETSIPPSTCGRDNCKIPDCTVRATTASTVHGSRKQSTTKSLKTFQSEITTQHSRGPRVTLEELGFRTPRAPRKKPGTQILAPIPRRPPPPIPTRTTAQLSSASGTARSPMKPPPVSSPRALTADPTQVIARLKDRDCSWLKAKAGCRTVSTSVHRHVYTENA
jgi:hypothetical protein